MGINEDKRNCGVFADRNQWVIWCKDQMVKRGTLGTIYRIEKFDWVSNPSFRRITSHKLTQWSD